MRAPLLLPALLIFTACTHSTQLTSGAEYLAAPGMADVDAEIAAVAAVEPDMRFPARIGVARVVNGELSLPAADEAGLLAEMASRHPEIGTFVPVSPLISDMVNGANGSGKDRSTTADIRRAAARQHLDLVLIYEIGAQSKIRDTPFALADVTLIGGAFLPTRQMKIAGVGQAILIDVRNGYPYGTASATKDLSGLARSFGIERRSAALRDRAADKVAVALMPEIEAMLVDLYRQAGS